MSEEAVAIAFACGLVAGVVLSGFVSWWHFKEEADIYRELSESAARYEKYWRGLVDDWHHYVRHFRTHSEAFLEALEVVVQEAEQPRKEDK